MKSNEVAAGTSHILWGGWELGHLSFKDVLFRINSQAGKDILAYTGPDITIEIKRHKAHHADEHAYTAWKVKCEQV